MTELRDRIVALLAADGNDECGWLSDAQDARLEWDEDNRAIRFCGEGSIDVGHIASIAAYAMTRQETGDE